MMENHIENYIKGIEKIAAKCTGSQLDGYSQILRICDAIKEETTSTVYTVQETSDALKNHIIWLMNMVIIMWMNMVQCLLSCQRKRVKHILRNTF